MQLTEMLIKNAKAQDKRYKLLDRDGLYLEVMTSGAKYWRLRYWFEKKEHRIALGEYPSISLKEARMRRDMARKLLHEGIDPKRQKVVSGDQPDTAATFGSTFEEWMTKRINPVCSPSYIKQVRSRVVTHLLPYLANTLINEISSLDLLNVIRRIEANGTIDVAHRVKQISGQVFRYGIATGVCENDPSVALKGALQAHKPKHRASIIDPRQLAVLLQAIEAYPSTVVRCAMKLQVLTFVRPIELRAAEWSEIDISATQWIIPGPRMKMRQPHVVPLSTQALAVLEELRQRTGLGRYVFPSARSPKGNRPMSENAVLVALRSMGFEKDIICGHGFRGTASTLLNANGWNRDYIERQLAHQDPNSVRASYNFADYLPERREMMQWWGDYLDKLKK
ncbi:tyrosine-type recombinase/integrase [Cloacibacillus porcorum]